MTFYLNTLGIRRGQIFCTICNKMTSYGPVSEDKTGKVCLNSLIDESVKQCIRDHFNCFENVESHYCRKDTTR